MFEVRISGEQAPRNIFINLGAAYGALNELAIERYGKQYEVWPKERPESFAELPKLIQSNYTKKTLVICSSNLDDANSEFIYINDIRKEMNALKNEIGEANAN